MARLSEYELRQRQQFIEDDNELAALYEHDEQDDEDIDILSEG